MKAKKWGLTTFMLVLVLSIIMGAFGLVVGRAQAPKAKTTLIPTIVIPAATPTMTEQPALAMATISGRVWHDLCAVGGGGLGVSLSPSAGCVSAAYGGFRADGVQETGEPGLGGVSVQLGLGACPAAGYATTISNMDGAYSLTGLSAGTYCVSVDALGLGNGLLLPGEWTYPVVKNNGSFAGHTVTLLEGERRPEVNFGWDYQFLPVPEPASTEATATAVPQPTPTSTPLSAVACTDRATFVKDVTIPDNTRLLLGQSFVKTWRLRNSGTCTWSKDYALVFAGGHSLGGPVAVPLQKPVAPGETVDLSVTLTAPAGYDIYESNWQLRTATGDRFGIGRNADTSFWVKILVAPTATATATPVPTPKPPTPIVTPTFIPVSNRWRGEYYGNRDLTGSPILVREDSEINFNWGAGAPAANIPADGFSARWSRTVSLSAGKYRFYALSDDGVRVWLNGELIIDRWHDSSGTTHAAERTLGSGAHTLRVEYYENLGMSRILFWWEREGDFPQWYGAYYPNVDLRGVPTLVRNDAEIKFNWGQGAPAAGLPTDGFSVRWTRNMIFEDGTYRFHVSVDDGARLYVDSAVVVDTWRDGAVREVVGDYRLSAGYHTLTVEYYERTGQAFMQLWWEKIQVFPDWRGEYWSNVNLSGNPALVRNDAVVDFAWGLGSPASNIPADNFSARWSRNAHFDADTYRFHVIVDDGVRLFVDDRLVIDAWRDGAARELTVDLPLVQGQHGIRLEYYERGDNARVRLWWEKVSAASYPDWKGEYWSNPNLSGNPTLLRNDKNIDFSWGKGAPAAGLPADNFAARWSRQMSFEPGIYGFNARADDGIRFYLDGRLLLDEWHRSDGQKSYVVSTPLAGDHKLVVEYYEAGGEALIKFWWEKVGEVPTPTPVPNRPPVAVDDSVSTLEDTAVGVNVLANDSDPDGDGLVVHNYQMVSTHGGRVSCTVAGVCTYTPAANFNGVDIFTYTVGDGKGGVAMATVTVTVNAVNDLPVAVDDTAITDEEKPVVVNVLANDTDPDGDRLTVSGYDAVSIRGGTVSCTSAGVCTYNPPVDFSGDDSFTYTVGDGKGGTDSATVTVTVKPVAGPVNVRLNEILPAPGAVVDWDGDGAADKKDEWIELFNAGSAKVDLEGWSLAAGEQVYVLPQGTILNADAFLVLYLKQTGIVLDDEGGQVWLLGSNGEARDSANYPSLEPDTSYSRDEHGIWHSDWSPSPGKVNTPSGPAKLSISR